MKELLEKYGIESIEEIAFKDRTELAHLNGIDLLNIIEFLQKDRKQWINQFTQTHNESVEIQKENNELKKQIENYQKINNFKTYKLFIRQYNILANDYVTYERTIKTKDLYHEIGKIYCTEMCAIKRIDYYEIEGE